MTAILCDYCKAPATLLRVGEIGYPYARDYGPVWACVPCRAHVGCHPNLLPLGRLANKELRDAKIEAHRAFDMLWKDWDVAYPDLRVGSAKIRRTMKGRAYAWLAEQMGLSVEDTHIGMFGLDHCHKVVDIIDKLRPTAATVRAWAKEREHGEV